MVDLTALLNRAYAELAEAGLNFTASTQSVEVTRDRVADGVCHVAVDEGRLVGTANLVVRFDETDPADYRLPGVAAFGQFGVDPDRRGEGIGDALLEACAATARSMGYTRLMLDTAEPAEWLIAYYTKRGFRPVGTHQWRDKTYRSVVMSRDL